MGMPSIKRVKEILQKLENAEGTLMPPENPTPLEKFRHDIQQKFVRYKREKNISQREMAKYLGIDEVKVSKLLHNHLDKFSTDRLIKLYSKLDPNVKLKVS